MEELTGYKKLKMAVERDCNEKNSCGCFNPDGCNVANQRKDGKSCFHAYFAVILTMLKRIEPENKKTRPSKCLSGLFFYTAWLRLSILFFSTIGRAWV